MFYFLTHGLDLPNLALTLSRIAIGLFFILAGYHKLFHAERHEALRQTLIKCGIPFVPFMVWWVPFWEFVAGILLVLGLLSSFAAIVLVIVMLVALCSEGHSKVMKYQPINKADYVCDVLYLPETLYIIGLLIVICGGGGYTLDKLFF